MSTTATCNYIGLRTLEVEVERATVESDLTAVLESRLVFSVSGSLVSTMCDGMMTCVSGVGGVTSARFDSNHKWSESHG